MTRKPAQPSASCQASPCTHNPPRVVHTLLYSLNWQRGYRSLCIFRMTLWLEKKKKKKKEGKKKCLFFWIQNMYFCVLLLSTLLLPVKVMVVRCCAVSIVSSNCQAFDPKFHVLYVLLWGEKKKNNTNSSLRSVSVEPFCWHSKVHAEKKN